MEASRNPPVTSTSKPRVMSLFPLWKLKDSHPVMTPSAWAAHLEEESTSREECINSEDPGGIEGITEKFIVCLARAVKDAQQVEKHCYHCGSLDHFIQNCPLVVGSRVDRAVKDAQQVEKHCYHCGSLDHFIQNCPLVVGSRVDFL